MAQRLDTPLSRALLDGGKVDPSALEDAIQQQLIHGGALDTILLEMGLVDEKTLARLLAQAWGTEPVDPAQVDKPDPVAARALPERMAIAMRVCPLLVDDRGLHVLVSAPLDKALLEEVGGLLQRPLVAHVVPEVRLWQGLARAYGAVPEERFVSLLASVSGAAPRKATPRIEHEVDGDTAEPAPAEWDLIEAFAHLAAQESRDGIVRVAARFARKYLPFAALFGVRPSKDAMLASESGSLAGASCVGWVRSGPAEGVQFSNQPFVIGEDCLLAKTLGHPAPFVGRPELTEGNSALFGWLGRRRARTFIAVPIVVGGRAVGALVADGGIRAREVHSLADVVSFGARLGAAFEALLRQRHKQHPSLFPVAASAVSASPVPAPPPLYAPPTMPPLSAPSMPPAEASSDLLNALVAFAPSESGVPAPPPMPPRPAPRPITITMPAMELPPSSSAPAAREPVPLREGPHRDGTSPFARAYVPPPKAEVPLTTHPTEPDLTMPPPIVRHGSSMDEVLPKLAHIEAPAALQSFAGLDDKSAPAAWEGALTRTVTKGHQGGTAPNEAQPRIFLDDEGWEDVVMDAAHAADNLERKPAPIIVLPSMVESVANAAPDARPPQPEPQRRLEIAPPMEEERSLAELVDDLAAHDANVVARAQRDLVARGPSAVAALAQRFPGRLLRDPFDPNEVTIGPVELGPLVDVLAQLGDAGLEAAIPHLDSRYPAYRFAAVLLFAQTPDPRAIDLLRARLHDQEPRIQKLAADALAPFVAHPRFESVLMHLRERLAAPLVDARRRAVELAGAFRDVGAVPSLIALLAQSDKQPELHHDVREALRFITLQDHGEKPKGWDRWWQRAKKKTRVDWLLEGLSSEDRELRAVAGLELAAMAGDDFGFHPDGKKSDRKRGIEALTAWWADAQKRKSA